MPGKTKRKEFGEKYDDFSETSLSQPATKIRRLDMEFAANMDQKQMAGYMLDGALPGGGIIDAGLNPALIRNGPFLPPMVNEERALVLYKPVYANLGPSLTIDPQLVTGLKNFAFSPESGNVANKMFGKDDQSSSTGCLAMVPWLPSRSHQSTPLVEVSTSGVETLEEPMEEEMVAASMEIEDEGFHQVPQHCMAPELPPTTAPAPIMWS